MDNFEGVTYHIIIFGESPEAGENLIINSLGQ
jgi:hypothetical protein